MPNKGAAYLAIGVGGILTYSAVKGYSLLTAMQNLIRGESPNMNQTASLLVNPNTNVVTGLASESQIASDAERYNGEGYVWGGAPANGLGNWDCSSFANWVCGHDIGLAIPGYAAGTYTGTTHGPTTVEWSIWTGLETISNGGSMQPGDLAIWQTHMGIVTGPNQMISAQDQQSGTGYSNVIGAIPGEILLIRRYKPTTVSTHWTGKP